MRKQLEKIVPCLAEVRELIYSSPIVSWGRIFRHTAAAKSGAIFGHLAALPFQEKMKGSLAQTSVSEDDARSVIRTRMATFFHKLRIHHSEVKDITLLCGLWRLDAHDSPEYNDMKPKAEVRKATAVSQAEEFLRRTRTFDVSECTNSLEKGSDAVLMAQARKLFDHENAVIDKYATLQSKELRTTRQKGPTKNRLLLSNELELRRRVEKYFQESEEAAKKKRSEKDEQSAKDAELMM